MSKLLLVTTVSGDEARLRRELGDVLEDAEFVRVIAPATDVSWLDWLTNAEDDARDVAGRAAQDAADAAEPEASVEIDRASQDTDAAQAVLDALRTFDADQVVVVTRPGEDSTWLEKDALEAAVRGAGVPVRHVELAEKD
jgi:hypothetical protein